MADLHIIERWQRETHPTDDKRALTAIRLRGLYETLAVQLFHQYEPTKKISPRVSRDFFLRLNEWLECFDTDKDRWIAFRSIEYLFFAGQLEFEELYRCALDHVMIPWLVDQSELDIFSPTIDSEIETALNACWPCPVTDSLRINSFLHVTGMAGQSLRPDWTSLKTFADPEKLESYKNKNGIKYLVLLEDFVGSGGQLSRALKFAAETFNGPILVVPLIICAPGDKKITDEIANFGRNDITYQPVLTLDAPCLVGPDVNPDEPMLFADLRHIMKKGYMKMACELDGEEYGWGQVGSLMVMYSNCPNNTPPIFHHVNPNWKPLFPRSVREVIP